MFLDPYFEHGSKSTHSFEEFIFFSNYNSPKAIEFRSHDQISCAIFWSEVNIQIRIKAFIQKTSVSFNNLYFKSRSLEKNALAISSNQSKKNSDKKTGKSWTEVKLKDRRKGISRKFGRLPKIPSQASNLLRDVRYR